MMKRIQEKNLGFVTTEKKRQKQLLESKISDNKKKEIQQKIDILTAFETANNQKLRSEL